MGETKIILRGNNDQYKCDFRSLLIVGIRDHKNFVEDLKKVNYSPKCLDEDQIRFIRESGKDTRGVIFGTHIAASAGIGVEGGFELIMTALDEETLMVGIVSYKGAGISLGLPVGASITTGVIHGNCRSIDQYLGIFYNLSALGLNKSYGKINNDGIDKAEYEANEESDSEELGCNSSSNTTGLSLSLLGYSITDYKKYSPYYLLKGKRAKEMIDFINSRGE